MRYPLWAFFFVVLLPPITLHALLIGEAEVVEKPVEIQVAIATGVIHHRF